MQKLRVILTDKDSMELLEAFSIECNNSIEKAKEVRAVLERHFAVVEVKS